MPQITIQDKIEGVRVPKWKLEKQMRDRDKANEDAKRAALSAEQTKQADKLRLLIIAAKTEAADRGIEFDEGAFVEKVKTEWKLASSNKDSTQSTNTPSFTRQKQRLTDVPNAVKDQYLLYVCAAKSKAEENGTEFDEAICMEHFLNAVTKNKQFKSQEDQLVQALSFEDITTPFNESVESGTEEDDEDSLTDNDFTDAVSGSPDKDGIRNISPQSVAETDPVPVPEGDAKEQIRMMIQLAKQQAEAAGIPFSESQFVLSLVLKKKQDFLELKKAVREVTQSAEPDIYRAVTDMDSSPVHDSDDVDTRPAKAEVEEPQKVSSVVRSKKNEAPELTPVATPDRSTVRRMSQIKSPPTQEKILNDKTRLAMLAARAAAEENGDEFDEEAFKTAYLTKKAEEAAPRVEEKVRRPRLENSDHVLKELAAAATLSILPNGIREKDRDRLAALMVKARLEEAGKQEEFTEMVSKIEEERLRKERADRRAAKDAQYKSNVGLKSVDRDLLEKKSRAERRAAMETQFKTKLSQDSVLLQEKQQKFQEIAIVPSRSAAVPVSEGVVVEVVEAKVESGDSVVEDPVTVRGNEAKCPPELDTPAPNVPQSPEPAPKTSTATKKLQDKAIVASTSVHKKEGELGDGWDEEAFIKCYFEAVKAKEAAVSPANSAAIETAASRPVASTPTPNERSFKSGYLEAIKAKDVASNNVSPQKQTIASSSPSRPDVLNNVAAKTLGFQANGIREKDRERLTALMLKSRLEEEGGAADKYSEILSKAEEAAVRESTVARRNAFKQETMSRFASSSTTAKPPMLSKKQKQLAALNDIYKLAVVAERNIAKETGQAWDEEAFKKCFLMAAQTFPPKQNK